MPKGTNPYPRTCTKCGRSEIDIPFPPKGNQCKRCLQDYNTVYQRNRRGNKPRSEKLSPEERHQRKIDSNKRWRADDPVQAKKSDKKAHDKQYANNPEKIKKRSSDWQKNNLEWRREYNKQRRAHRPKPF